jgi:hypothetical protein
MGLFQKPVRRYAGRLKQLMFDAKRAYTAAEARSLLDAQCDAQRASTVAEVRSLLDAQWDRIPDSVWLRARVDKGTQTLLHLAYQDLVRQGKPLPRIDEVGFRAYSQFDEDGILLFLFSVYGAPHKISVEICAGVGFECNSANLIINHAWDGLLFDGNAENVRHANAFYRRCPDTFWRPPVVRQAWIDVETINDRISENGFSGEIDLLSLDLDGVDFWIWKAITCINPRVVVVEFNCCIPADVSVAIPYDRNFVVTDEKPGYLNASLAAWAKLGREKGYRLVGINRNAVNAFFVRDDLRQDLVPEVSVASCLQARVTRTEAKRWAAAMSAWEWVTI